MNTEIVRINYTETEATEALKRAIKRRNDTITELRKEVFDKAAFLVGGSVLFCIFFLAIMILV